MLDRILPFRKEVVVCLIILFIPFISWAQVPVNDSPCINDSNPPIELTDGIHEGTTCGATFDFENIDCNSSTAASSVWYIYTPNTEDKGYLIELEGTTIEGNVTVEVYRGDEGMGCDGFIETLATSCTIQNTHLRIPNCGEEGDKIFIKITTGSEEGACGAFRISINSELVCEYANTCEEALEALTTITQENCGDPILYAVQPGCLDLACPSENSACSDDNISSVWFKINIDDINATTLITQVAAPGFDAVWSVYEGTSCEDRTIVSQQISIDGVTETFQCSNSDGDVGNLFQTPINPNAVNNNISYWVEVIAEGEVDDPNFDLFYNSILSCTTCVGDSPTDCDNGNYTASILEDGEWVEVEDDYPFCQGMDVQVCLEFNYNTTGSGNDWLHGFVPIFGPGWDVTEDYLESISPVGNFEFFSASGECAPFLNGYDLPNMCTYIEDGVLKLCNSACDVACPCSGGMQDGDPLPSGYWFNTSGASSNCGQLGCSPASFYGWPNGTDVNVNVCFDLKTKLFDAEDLCEEDRSLKVFVQAFSDAITGCWVDDNACIQDPSYQGPPWEIECNSPPSVIAVNDELCISGTTDIMVQTEDGSAIAVIVTPIPNDNITGANAYNFPEGYGVITDELVNTSNETQVQQYTLKAVDPLLTCQVNEEILEVTIDAVLDAYIPTQAICDLDCVDLYVEFNACGLHPYTYQWSTGEITDSITVCPTESTEYIVTIVDSNDETTVLQTEVRVNPEIELLLPDNIVVCKDDHFDSEDPDYIVCLDILSGKAPYNVEWETEIVLVGEKTGVFGECFVINEVLSSSLFGDPGYTLTANVTDSFGCVGSTNMEVEVAGELTIVAEIVPYDCEQTIVSINATGIDAVGNPVTTFLVYGGCTEGGLGDFLDEVTSTTGTVVIDVDLDHYTCYTIVGQIEGCQKSVDVEFPIIEPIDILYSTDICEGSTATISILNDESFVSYEWTPDIGNSSSITFMPDVTQTYIVDAFDDEGCKSTEAITITVLPSESPYCADPCETIEADYIITGTTYSDNNDNGVFDQGDVPLNNVIITDNSTGFTTFTNILGEYVIPVAEGVNSLTAYNSIGNWESDELTLENIDVVQPCTGGVDFSFLPEGSVANAQITVTNSIVRCDWETRFYVTVENLDHEEIDGEVVFTFDDKASFFSSGISSIQVVGNEVTFQTGTLPPFGQNTYEFKLKMPGGSANLPMLDFKAEFILNGEIEDEYEHSQQLLCSYDPNDKRTNPDREGEENLTLIEETIDYTIRFQNNGNDTAFHVRIVDVLDPYVDQSSLRFNSSSHPYYACLMNDTLILDFNNIRLVDSMTNYPASQGYVNFSMNVDPSIPEGVIVTNTADIIFDTNEPIVTNTVLNTMVYDFCTDPMTELSATICTGEEYMGYSETGIYQDTIITEEGCDSLLNIDLTVIPQEFVDLEYSICEGEEVEYEGVPYLFESSGLYTIEIGGVSGCIEKTLFFDMTIIPTIYMDEEMVTICEGESYEGFDSTGVYMKEEIDPNTSCPIIRTINLVVTPVIELNLDYTICEGDIIEYEDNVYTFEESGQFTIENGGASGCVEERLFFYIEIIETITLETEQITICEDENYEGLDSTGVYTFNLVDPDTGCPIIRTVDLTVLPLNDVECLVATSTIIKSNIKIYPVPTTDKLYIDSDYPVADVRIYSTAGSLMYQSRYKGQKNLEIDVLGYPSGLYFIHIDTEKGRLIDKIVVN